MHFDASAPEALKSVLRGAPELFQEEEPERADAILFGSDEFALVGASPLARRHRAKCLCVSETDIPTFALPGLYAANSRGLFTAGRTETISYFLSEHAGGNPAVRSLIGRPVEKRWLYSFLGGSNSWARKRLFRLVKSADDTIVEATNSYHHWSTDGQDAEAQARQRLRYAEVLAQSKFSLCPRGCGLSSYRLFESMSLGVVPVIIADRWRPVSGVDWSFALFVREAQLSRLDAIVRAHEPEWRERGQAAQAAYARVFAPERIAATVHQRLLQLLASYRPAREAALAPALRARVLLRDARWGAIRAVKPLVLRALSLSRLPSPVLLRYPLEDQIAWRQKLGR